VGGCGWVWAHLAKLIRAEAVSAIIIRDHDRVASTASNGHNPLLLEHRHPRRLPGVNGKVQPKLPVIVPAEGPQPTPCNSCRVLRATVEDRDGATDGTVIRSRRPFNCLLFRMRVHMFRMMSTHVLELWPATHLLKTSSSTTARSTQRHTCTDGATIPASLASSYTIAVAVQRPNGSKAAMICGVAKEGVFRLLRPSCPYRLSPVWVWC
jgi:hypothetical protein